jgi:hypothetical protein
MVSQGRLSREPGNDVRGFCTCVVRRQHFRRAQKAMAQAMGRVPMVRV